MILKSGLFAVLILGLLGATQETYAAPTPPTEELPLDFVGTIESYELANTIVVQDKDSCLELSGTKWEDPNVCKVIGNMVTPPTKIIQINSGIEFYIDVDGLVFNSGTIKNFGTITNHGEIHNYKTIENFGTITNHGETLTNYGKIKNYGTIENHGAITNHIHARIWNYGTVINFKTIVNNYDIYNYGKLFNYGMIDFQSAAGPSIINHGELFNGNSGIMQGAEHLYNGILKPHAFIHNYNQFINYGEIYDFNTLFNYGIIENHNKIYLLSHLANYDVGTVNNFSLMNMNGYLGYVDNDGAIYNCINFINFYYNAYYEGPNGIIEWNYSGCVLPIPLLDSDDSQNYDSYSTLDSSKTRQKNEQKIASDETRVRDEATDSRDLEILQLQEENNELKSKVSVLEKKIQGLNAIIMEQIKVMLETLGIR